MNLRSVDLTVKLSVQQKAELGTYCTDTKPPYALKGEAQVVEGAGGLNLLRQRLREALAASR